MKKIILIIAVISLTILLFLKLDSDTANVPIDSPVKTSSPTQTSVDPAQNIIPEKPPALQTFKLSEPARAKTLENEYHVFQTFNNCGPASLSMIFSYYGINKSQKELGQELRPYQNPRGDNDDKSVTLEELSRKSEEYGFVAYYRPNGNIELLKLFIAYDIPVIVKTLTKENEDIGHYRVVKGYNDTTGEIIYDDSFQGKNLKLSYESFNKIWEKFNFEYLAIIPKDKVVIAEAIIGEDKDINKAWEKAAKNARELVEKYPENIFYRFNLSVALYNTGAFQESVAEFEKVEDKLPFRVLWYQIEPIQAYFALGDYERVFYLTDRILNNYNKAFSELYLIRGEIYKIRGDAAAAKNEFEKAVFYNINLTSAKEALDSLQPQKQNSSDKNPLNGL